MNERRNKDGLTEAEFLARYDARKYPPVFVTVDIVLLNGSRVLLIRRGDHPWLGRLALPGGFVEPGDDAESAARREMKEETGVQDIRLRQLPVKSRPGRDPRARIVTVPFLACFANQTETVRAGDDAAEADWWDLDVTQDNENMTVRLTKGEERETVRIRRILPKEGFPEDIRYEVLGDSPLASDHAEILASALDLARQMRVCKGENE